jgi:hypothetical protein
MKIPDFKRLLLEGWLRSSAKRSNLKTASHDSLKKWL